MKNTLIILLFSSVLVNLTACSMVPSNANDISGASIKIINGTSADIRHANQLLRQGKKLEAASAYYQASRHQPSPQRERLVLQAAEIATYVKNKSLAKHYLSKVNPSSLSNENRARRAYVLALISILDNNYQAALNILPTQRGNISTALWNKIHRVRQRASRQSTGTRSGTTNSVALPQNVNQVAVLLPLSGKLGSLGDVILRGIDSSKQVQAPNMQIKTYDVANTDILTQYKRAVDEGADVIIGPLDKRKLSVLVNQHPQLVRPVISLNHLSAGQGAAPTALYQFGLAPEDEARQVAGFAASRGQRRAAILYPDSQWGRRLAGAFKRMYASQGGQIITESAYPNTSSSYKSAVKQALVNGVNDIDMIFLAASPTQARMIRPMIQHLHGENIPVYATSHIYSGQPNAGKNIDLDGIIYTEIPYIIEGSQLGAIIPSMGKYPRLFAMGADALLIAKNINAMARGGKALQGKTGNIRIGGNRFLQRQLAWATFVNGLTTSYGE